jgi:hypothetical protein
MSEKNKIESIVKKDINSYKLVMEEIDRKYAMAYKNYKDQLMMCQNVKRKLERVIENKTAYENIINSFKEELYHINLINSMNKIKDMHLNYGFNNDKGKKKKSILEVEIMKFNKKLDPIKEELARVNNELLENVKNKF